MKRQGSSTALVRAIENAVIARLVTSYAASKRENEERRKEFNRLVEEHKACKAFVAVSPFVEIFSLLQTVRGAVNATTEAELFTVEVFNRTLKQMERARIICFIDPDGYGRAASIAFTDHAEKAYMKAGV